MLKEFGTQECVAVQFDDVRQSSELGEKFQIRERATNKAARSTLSFTHTETRQPPQFPISLAPFEDFQTLDCSSDNNIRHFQSSSMPTEAFKMLGCRSDSRLTVLIGQTAAWRLSYQARPNPPQTNRAESMKAIPKMYHALRLYYEQLGDIQKLAFDFYDVHNHRLLCQNFRTDTATARRESPRRTAPFTTLTATNTSIVRVQ